MKWCLWKLQNQHEVDLLGLPLWRRIGAHRQLQGQEVEKPSAPSPRRPTLCSSAHGSPRGADWLRLPIVLLEGLLSVVAAQGQKSTIANLPTLTKVSQVRRLTIEEAERRYPVRLRAVVTYYNWDAGDLFIQDSTAGIWVDPGPTRLTLHQGEFVQVEGLSAVGDFAPQIEHAHFRSLGEARMPNPRRPTSDELASGRWDSQWIELQGVVRSVAELDGGLVLNISSGAIECRVFMLNYPSFPTDIVDGRIRLRGVFAGLYDSSNTRFIGFQVLTPNWSNVEVLENPTQAMWSAPVRPMRLFLRLTPEGAFTHRVHVRGVVTFQQLGGLLCIRDSDGALLINTTQPTPLKVGDLVDAIGFPALGDYTVIMRDAIFQRAGAGQAPQPVAVNPERLPAGSYNADLVRLSARLLNCTTRPGEVVLGLQAGPVTFRAVLNTRSNSTPLGALRTGSLLQLTGVMIVEADKNHEPKGFEILLRSPADLVVLDLPSWWTARRISWLLIVLAGMVFWISIWVAVLRRQVEERTETIRATLESTVDGILVVNSAGKVVAYNRKFAHLWRIPESILGSRDDNEALNFVLSQVKDPEAFLTRVRQTYADHDAQSDDVIEFKDGRVFERHSEPQRVQGRNVGRVWGFRDITERKRAGEAQRFLACIVESSKYSIFATDPNGTIVSWNNASEALFGYTASEILGKHVSTLVPLDRLDEVPRVLDKLRQGEGISNFETTPMRKDGARLIVSLTVSPIKGTAGEVMGTATIAHDISKRKRAELELREAKEAAEAANQAKSEFLANMSHEIRTPMNGVLGMTELALNTNLTSEQREYLEMAKFSADRLLEVINDILDFSKIEAGKLDLEVVPFCVRESLAKITQPLALRAQQKGLKLLCDVRPDVPAEIVADPTRLSQVLCNLLDNAIKFTSQGEVELRAGLARRDRSGVVLHFSVRDTGIGIPREKQNSIFEAFAQADSSTSRKFGGTGLGLTISARLVEMMGGRIWVESQPGEGSCFHFTAQVGVDGKPVDRAQLVESTHATLGRQGTGDTGPAQAAGGGPCAEGPNLRVLIAEDNAVNQKLVVHLLEKQGHSVMVVGTGLAALEALDGQEFDVVLMDVQMPDMDGFEATAAIREREKGTTKHQPIVAMTAYAMRGDQERCLAAGMDGYVSKPVSGPALASEVNRVCTTPANGQFEPVMRENG